jgi:CheY-like chemotaxis protein
MEVVVANHGKEAADFARAETFDLVLMDVQMPVMGGYEATRLIRAQEAGTGRHVPIVAMTAHAMQGVREECLQVGMDDYVSKPIDTDRLFRTLSKWVSSTTGAENGAEAAESAPRATHASAAPVLALVMDQDLSFLARVPSIDRTRGLDRLNRNAKLYRKLLLEFAEKYGGQGDRLLDLFRRQDTQALQNQLHALKGVAGNLSIHAVQALAGELETTDVEAPGFEKRLLELDAALRSTAVDISQADCVLSVRDTTEALSSDQVQALVYDILDLLENDNLEAERSIENFLNAIDPEAFAEDILSIRVAVRGFDFEAAQDPFRRIAQGSGYQTGGAR